MITSHYDSLVGIWPLLPVLGVFAHLAGASAIGIPIIVGWAVGTVVGLLVPIP